MQVQTTHGSSGSASVTFSKTYSTVPNVIISMYSSNRTTREVFLFVKNITTSGFTIGWYNTNTATTGVDFSPYVYWLAIPK